MASTNQPSQNDADVNMPLLKCDRSGISVKILQRLLTTHGHSIAVDGNFGKGTEAAVKAFQQKRKLLADGIVGDRTWQALTETQS